MSFLYDTVFKTLPINEERRTQLLDCAGPHVLQQGLLTLTMDRLATEAGVSVRGFCRPAEHDRRVGGDT